ncbi:hypothetical protein AMTR_s00138p00034810 [Amborella trichopoda]|uniref:Uncharacterized protein n=1 Tax=Amborella trichopoda TaxID=13333 RepID=W1NEJ4_AMBTC|nr:hypothetical protein AMTR_s00138p00034810 [Amborella trichopoda]
MGKGDQYNFEAIQTIEWRRKSKRILRVCLMSGQRMSSHVKTNPERYAFLRSHEKPASGSNGNCKSKCGSSYFHPLPHSQTKQMLGSPVKNESTKWSGVVTLTTTKTQDPGQNHLGAGSFVQTSCSH